MGRRSLGKEKVLETTHLKPQESLGQANEWMAETNQMHFKNVLISHYKSLIEQTSKNLTKCSSIGNILRHRGYSSRL